MLLKLARFERKKALAKKPALGRKLNFVEKHEQLNLLNENNLSEGNSDIADTTHIYKIQERYYIITLEQDLFGDYIITRINGRLNTALGQKRQELIQVEAEAKKRFDELVKYREEVRYYQLSTLKNFDEK